MDGKGFIALAGKLAAPPAADEATCRTAISRAYYGAFHVARSFLVGLGFAPLGNANVHGFVQHCLNGSGFPEACRAASLLTHLQSARNRADYRLDELRFGSHQDAMLRFGSHQDAMLCVEQAHLVVSALESCRADEARDSIRQAIAEYERKIHPR